MRRTNKIILAVLIMAVMSLGIGYAAIQNITLNITGTATANPNQANFSVKFSGTPTVSDPNKVLAAITDDTNATINVEGLTSAGDTVSATYTIQNISSDLSADLVVDITNSNKEYFLIESELANTSLKAGEATTLTITIQLIKTPVSSIETSTIGMQLTVAPVQPGEEGNGSGTGNGTDDGNSGIPSITNQNIGDYIDLGNNIIGTESTADDWRILYVEDDKIYAILASYLPHSTGDTAKAQVNVLGEYDVYLEEPTLFSDKPGEYFVNQLKGNSWDRLGNGIANATVQGAPTKELIIQSYREKTGTEMLDGIYIDNTIEDYDLYVPEEQLVSQYGRSLRVLVCKFTRWLGSERCLSLE